MPRKIHPCSVAATTMKLAGGYFTAPKLRGTALFRLGGVDEIVDGWVLHAAHAPKTSAVPAVPGGGGDDDVVDRRVLYAAQARKRSAYPPRWRR
jgi:hypothetical protein